MITPFRLHHCSFNHRRINQELQQLNPPKCHRTECDEEGEAEEEPQNDDKEEDRVYQNEFNLVEWQLNALYNNGWFTGDVIYFNTALNEYKDAI